MAERAGVFENTDDFDVSGFAPKKPIKSAAPAPEAVREVSEGANFKSREPAPKPVKKADRRHRTGRNAQLNVKVTAEAQQEFYKMCDELSAKYKWVQGEVLERAIKALQREEAQRSGQA
jgi:hypothetical protein